MARPSGLGGGGLGEPGGVEAVLAGEDGAWPAASARPAQSRGGREGRERERVERERDSNLKFFSKFLTET